MTNPDQRMNRTQAPSVGTGPTGIGLMAQNSLSNAPAGMTRLTGQGAKNSPHITRTTKCGVGSYRSHNTTVWSTRKKYPEFGESGIVTSRSAVQHGFAAKALRARLDWFVALCGVGRMIWLFHVARFDQRGVGKTSRCPASRCMLNSARRSARFS